MRKDSLGLYFDIVLNLGEKTGMKYKLKVC